MRKIFIILFFVAWTCPLLQAQDDNGLGFFTKEEIRERDSLNYVGNTQRILQTDSWYKEMTRHQYNPQLAQKISKAVHQARGGVTIETTAPTRNTSSGNRVTQQQAQQIKKAQREAEHRAWLEQKWQAEARAAEQRQMEKQRRQIEQQRQHDRILNSELQRTSAQAAEQQAKINYRATEGRDFMYNYQPEGTEKIVSEYIPSSSTSSYSIADIIAKSGSKPIKLNGEEYYKSSTNWDEMLEKSLPKDKVKDYVNASNSLAELYVTYPQDLTPLLHDEFRSVSGFDIDSIMTKLPSERTKAEQLALVDYQSYRKEMLYRMANDIDGLVENEKIKNQKQIDAAILSEHVYNPYNHIGQDSIILGTNYKLATPTISKDDPMAGVANSILECNRTGNSTGFHAEIYKNEANNTYVIAIAGSDDWKDWSLNNAPNMLDEEVPQYNLAIGIAEAINGIPEAERAKLNIEIVGHSLGGGVASVIGLATGLDTKTFNSAYVSNSFLEKNGLSNRNASNITAFHTSTDLLTTLQQTANKPALGKPVDIGDPSTIGERVKAMAIGAVAGIATVQPIVGNWLVKKGEGHRIGPMVRSMKQTNREKDRVERDRLNHIRMELINTANIPEHQIQETILIGH